MNARRLLLLLWLFPWIADASILLAVPERGEGLADDPKRFASLGGAAEQRRGPTGFAEHLLAVQRHHLALDGRFPVVHWFFCTVYYIPREGGFTAAGGFDMTPDARLKKRRFPRSFVQSVRMEGTGRLANPGPKGESYICYEGNFRRHPLGNRNNPLTPRLSAAVHRRNPLFRHGTRFHVLDPAIWNTFGSFSFEAADTGGGLFPAQIDLFWGEDDPRSAWEIVRPASCDIAVRWLVPVVVVE
jgi:hypothetical protein